jgi:uncharacterized protein
MIAAEEIAMTLKIRAGCILLLLAAAAMALPAGAITVEEATRALERGRRVYDFAGVLTAADQRRLQERLAAMEQAGLAEGAVVIADRLEGTTVEGFTLALAERWKIGRQDVDNGFVLAVSIQERKWRLEVGRDLQGTLSDAATSRLMRENLVPAFRAGRYGDGLLAAVNAIQQQLEAAGGVEALPARPPAPDPAAPWAWLAGLLGLATGGVALLSWPRGATRDRWKLPQVALGAGALAAAMIGAGQAREASATILLLGVLPGAWAAARLLEGAWLPLPLGGAAERGRALAGAWILAVTALAVILFFSARSGWTLLFLVVAVPFGFAGAAYFQRAPRKCPECGGALRWLPEAEEARFLQPDENAEQQLGGVDYDVWRCEQCNRSAIFGHARAGAPVTPCPRCGRRTLVRRVVLDEQPTAWRDGQATEISECRNPRCDYREERRVALERGRYVDDGMGGILILPPMIGGWGGGSQGDSGGGGPDWSSGPDVGDFGGGGGFDGGGASGEW